MKKELGKIESIKFGLVGYQNTMLGISFTFSGKSWGIGTEKAYWDANLIEVKEYHNKWSEEDRDKGYAEIMRYISDLLYKAKVKDITQLKGIPVECTFDVNKLTEWRILTEVL